MLFAIIVLDGTIAGLVGPIEPRFVENVARPAVWMSAAALLFTVMGYFAAPVLGAISDGYGRRPVLLGAAVVTTASAFLLLPLRLGFLMANRFIDGASSGSYGALRSAVVDVSDEESLVRNTGLIDTAATAGFILGPAAASGALVVGRVSGIGDARAVVIASIVLAVGVALLCLRLPETRPAGVRPPIRWGAVVGRALNPVALYRRTRVLTNGNRRLWQLTVIEFFVNVGLGYYLYYLVLIAQGPLKLSPQGIANFSLYFATIVLTAQLVFFGRFAARVNRVRWLRWLFPIGVVLMAGYALAGDRLVLLLVVVAIDCVTFAFVPGLLEGLAAEAVPAEQRGELFGIRQSVSALAQVLSLALATALSGWWIGAPFVVFGVAFALAGWLVRSLAPLHSGS